MPRARARPTSPRSRRDGANPEAGVRCIEPQTPPSGTRRGVRDQPFAGPNEDDPSPRNDENARSESAPRRREPLGDDELWPVKRLASHAHEARSVDRIVPSEIEMLD